MDDVAYTLFSAICVETILLHVRPEQDELLVYPDSVSSVFRITDDIYSAATGLSGDVRYQVTSGSYDIVPLLYEDNWC